MQISQRQSVFGFLGLLLAGGFIVLAVQLLSGGSFQQSIPSIVGTLAIAGLLIAYWRGWDYARQAVIVIITLLVLATQVESSLLEDVSLSLLFPPVIALVFARPIWIIGSGSVVLIALIVAAMRLGVALDATMLVLYGLLVGGLVLARLVLETASQATERARQVAEDAARALEQANAGLEAQVIARTTQLQARTDEQARLMAEQAHLLGELEQQQMTIRALSVPVIPVSASTIVMPLIGALDRARLDLLQRQALLALEEFSARQMVLDITGVPVVDGPVAQGILSVVQAARLLGADVLLVGIRPEVAQAIVGLGEDLQGLRTYRDLASALEGTTTLAAKALP